MARRAEHRQVVGRDDAVAGDSVDERRIRHPQRHAVAAPEAVDVRERGEIRRSVSCDVDEPPSPGMYERRSRPGPFSSDAWSMPSTKTMFRCKRGTTIRPIAWPS